jgi:DNA-binding IscR family transcriptional regulator
VAGLEANGLLSTSEKEELLPGREMTRITLQDIVAVVRRDGETGSHQDPEWSDAVENLATSLDSAVASTLSDMTLSDILDESENNA